MTTYIELYEAARLALLGVLANQGLRPTARGGDAVICKVIYAQVTPAQRKIIEPFERMRAWRDAGITAAATAEDVRDTRAIIALAEQLISEYRAAQDGGIGS